MEFFSLFSLSHIVSDFVVAQQSTGIDCGDVEFLKCARDLMEKLGKEWFDKALKFGERIFIACITLEIVASGYSAIRKRGDMGDILQMAVIKVLGLTTIWLLIKFSTNWLGVGLLDFPVDIGTKAATEIDGRSGAVTPTYIAMIGWDLFATAFGSIPALSIWKIGMLPFVFSLLVLIASILVSVSFLRMAVELLKTIIEIHVVVGGGALILGFLAFRGTAPLAEGMIRYIVHLTIKLFFLTLVAFAVTEMAMGVLSMIDAIEARPPVNPFLLGMGISGGVYANAWRMLVVAFSMLIVTVLAHSLASVPDKLAQHLTQSLTVNIKAFLQQL